MVTMENAWILPALPTSAFAILALLNFAGIAQNLPRKGDFIAIIAVVAAFLGLAWASILVIERVGLAPVPAFVVSGGLYTLSVAAVVLRWPELAGASREDVRRPAARARGALAR